MGGLYGVNDSAKKLTTAQQTGDCIDTYSVSYYLSRFKYVLVLSSLVLLSLLAWYWYQEKMEVVQGLAWGYLLAVVNYGLLARHLDDYFAKVSTIAKFLINYQMRYLLLMVAFITSFVVCGKSFGLAALGGFSILKWLGLCRGLEDSITEVDCLLRKCTVSKGNPLRQKE